jgi:hypothetical protein
MSDSTNNDFDMDHPGSYEGGAEPPMRLSPVQPGYAALRSEDALDSDSFDDDLDDDLDDELDADLPAAETTDADLSAEPARTGLPPIEPGRTGGFGIADVLFPASPPPVKHARVIRSFG